MRTLRSQKHELEGAVERASFYTFSHLTDGEERPKRGIDLFKKAFHAVCGILVAGPGIEPVSPAVERWSLTIGPPGSLRAPLAGFSFPSKD